MSTWLLRNGTTTNAIGHSNTTGGGSDTYVVTRYWNSFDTSTVTMVLADIATVELYVMVTAQTSTDTYRCHSAISTDTNWGATLVADINDWTSTTAHLESNVAISSTGAKSFSIDKNNIDLAGTTYIRLMSTTEGEMPGTRNITIGSSSNATVANRPYLKFTSTTGTVIRLLAMTGVGI